MTRTDTNIRRITPENIDGAYDWTDDPEVKKEIAREELLRPKVDEDIMAAMRRSAERLMSTPAEPQPLRDRNDRIAYSPLAEAKSIIRKQ